MKHFICLLLSALCFHAVLPAQVVLVKNGKPSGRIVLTSGDSVDTEAARLLQDFAERITGAKLLIQKTDQIKKNDIVISNDGYNKNVQKDKLSEDGFRVVHNNHTLQVVTGGGKGSIYAIVSLLERYCGVSYWGENEYSLTQTSTLQIPVVDFTEIPSFRYRQSQNYAMATDSVYRNWMRLKTPGELFAGNLWVHTFDFLLPSAVYGDAHPEYYSYFNGRRHPGKASQWCLSNPEVLEIVTLRLDSVFKAHPDKHIISVSQNDGNYTFCQCEKCKAVDDYEGAHSGSLIHFMNKLAERFPDKEISTLAYLYSMKPPRHVKPAKNVNIMLCSIDCDREVTLKENASGRAFAEALEGWSAITENIFVWDYGINFDNYLVPFPNFHVLGENMRLFHKNNTSMHFSQIASSRGGDFAELRTWLVSKLMWNVNRNEDSLIQIFLNGYYGNAAPYLYQYIKLMEGALLGSGKRLWIYDSPVSHKAGMLKPSLMRRYNALFNQAEAAVAADPVLLKRVWRTRLPLQYSGLDIARTEKDMRVDDINRKLDLFEERVKLFSVPTLNERRNSPLDYCALYRTRYMPSGKQTIPVANITFSVAPSEKYATMGGELTDGLYGGMTFAEGWVGWLGTDAGLILDLGSEKEFTGIHADFLHQLGAWILVPSNVTYSISSDGNDYKTLQSIDHPEDRNPQVKFIDLSYTGNKPIKARYIKVDITGIKTCPHWHYGVGHPCWFFIDEIWIQK
ncbi:DUF4838 domain-containing protein [Agriterribacter sp.]|uniref:DUF4838 domain-containing protein n=1 Tax=Agriterribacter sp. TaxID=2821509 RepID=UPI002C732168|nr:DUF4838 domain-containing protein [Agriterribacter sp.]HRO46486.1 DUF4838 domain-containing protein [Agriterribacter sp.]HRQ19073.1 DUF4838 domain-containing protein [Agriterribacter sp.]